MAGLQACVVELPRISDPRGNLTFIQNGAGAPFVIERVFWTYDVPSGHVRGGHAYRAQEEIIVALSGAFDVVVNDGAGEQRFVLNRAHHGLYLPPLTWRHMENFSTNALALHLSSTRYRADDYIRDRGEFLRLSSHARQ